MGRPTRRSTRSILVRYTYRNPLSVTETNLNLLNIDGSKKTGVLQPFLL